MRPDAGPRVRGQEAPQAPARAARCHGPRVRPLPARGDARSRSTSQHDMSQEEVAQLEERYGVNDPLPVQYVAWLGGVLRGDLGWSGVAVAPVSEVLPARFVATMELATFGTLVAIFFGVGTRHLRRLATQPDGGPHHPGHHRERRQPSLVLVRAAALILFYLVIPIAPLGGSTRTLYADHPLHRLLHARRDPEPEPRGALGLAASPRAARPRPRVRGHGRHRADGPFVSRRGDGRGLRRLRPGEGPARAHRRDPRHARRNALVPSITVIGLSSGHLAARNGRRRTRLPLARDGTMGDRRDPARRPRDHHGLRPRHEHRLPAP